MKDKEERMDKLKEQKRNIQGKQLKLQTADKKQNI